MHWVVRVRNRGLVLWLGGAGGEGEVGLGVGVGVVGPAGAKEEEPLEEGCALIGLGAEIWDIHRGCGMSHWSVPKGFEIRIRAWRGEENSDSQSDG